MASSDKAVNLKSSEEEASKALDAALTTHVGAEIPYGALSSVPLGICALGQVMLTASIVTDKSINNPPPKGFKYIKYPDSLRTTLMQISNWGYEALNTGHLGMGMIHGYSKQIKAAAMEAAKTMQKATSTNQASVARIVALRLENIKLATESCQKESNKVVDALEKLLALMEETGEACSSSKTVGEAKLKENQNKKIVHEEEKALAEKARLQQEKEREEYEKQLKLTQEELRKALGEVPKGLALLGLQALDTIRNFIPFLRSKPGAVDLIKIRMEIAKEANLEAERKIAKAKEEMKATDRAFTEAVIQLSQLDLEKVSYEDAIEMLHKAVGFIAELLKHWRELQRFCQSFNKIIQLQLSDGTRKLENDLQLQLTLAPSDRSLMSDDILGQLRTISQQSYQIGCIGELYVKMSNRYIMPAIGALNENSAVDPSKIAEVRKELEANALKAHKEIVVAIEGEKKALLSKVETQKIKIGELLAIADDTTDFLI